MWVIGHYSNVQNACIVVLDSDFNVTHSWQNQTTDVQTDYLTLTAQGNPQKLITRTADKVIFGYRNVQVESTAVGTQFPSNDTVGGYLWNAGVTYVIVV